MALFISPGAAKTMLRNTEVQYLVEAECRFLLFAHHQAVMDTMQQTLEKMKVAGPVKGGGFMTMKVESFVEGKESESNTLRRMERLWINCF